MEVNRPITIAIIIFIIILLMYFFVVPKYYDFRNLQIKLSNTKAEYNGKFAYYSEVSKIFRQLEDRKEILDKIGNAISPKPQLADLIYFFQQKSKESGLIVQNMLLIKIFPITPEANVRKIVFSLSVFGNYQSFKNFLYLIESSSRLFEVNNVSFGSQTVNKLPSSLRPPLIIQPLAQEVYFFQLEIKTHSYDELKI